MVSTSWKPYGPEVAAHVTGADLAGDYHQGILS
jgi:hypothetical protein